MYIHIYLYIPLNITFLFHRRWALGGASIECWDLLQGGAAAALQLQIHDGRVRWPGHGVRWGLGPYMKQFWMVFLVKIDGLLIPKGRLVKGPKNNENKKIW